MLIGGIRKSFFAETDRLYGENDATSGDDDAVLFLLALSVSIQEYSEMIYFFDEKYVKKMMRCQGRIVSGPWGLTPPDLYDNLFSSRPCQSAASTVQEGMNDPI
jgi:hypothetical protein